MPKKSVYDIYAENTKLGTNAKLKKDKKPTNVFDNAKQSIQPSSEKKTKEWNIAKVYKSNHVFDGPMSQSTFINRLN